MQCKLSHLFIFLLPIHLLSSCNKKPDSLLTSGSAAATAASSFVNTNTENTVVTALIDGSTLQIYNLQAGNLQVAGVNQEVLSFSASPGTTYVEYTICPTNPVYASCPAGAFCAQGGQCYQQVTTYNQVIMTYVGGGPMTISAQACTSAQNSLTSVNCGPVNQINYNANRHQGALADLLARREGLFLQFKNTVPEMNQIFQTFVTNGTTDLNTGKDSSCFKENLQAYETLKAKVEAVHQYLQVPVETLLSVIKNIVPSEILSGLGTALSGLKKALISFCHSLANATNSNKTCEILMTIGTTVATLASAFLPDEMFSALTTAIKDVEDSSVTKQCTADTIFNTSFEAVNLQQQTIYTQIKNINAQIQAYGYQ